MSQSFQKNKILNVAFIGLGRVFAHYLDIISSSSELNSSINISCLIDVDVSPASLPLKYQSLFSGSVYFADYHAILEIKDNIDFVVICTPSGSHYEITRFLLANHINVLCEKPATMKYSEFTELCHISNINGCFYWVAFQNRYNPAILLAKSFIDKGYLGRLMSGSLVLRWSRDQDYYNSSPWRGTYSNDGGVVNNQAIHHFDALVYLVGAPSEILAVSSSLMNQSIEAEDTMTGLFKFTNPEAFLTYQVTTSMPVSDLEASISLFGEKGHIHIGGIALNEIVSCDSTDILDDSFFTFDNQAAEVPNGYGYGHKDLLLSVIQELNFGTKSMSSAEFCKSTSNLINSIYLSSEATSWIQMPNSVDNNLLGK